MVGIAGPTRAGKGTLVKALREQLPNCAGVLAQDRYFLKQGETPDCIDWRTLSRDLKRLLADARRKNSASRKRQVVLLEGFLMYSRPDIAGECHVKLFLNIDKETCCERRRATKSGGLHGAVFDQFFDSKVWTAYEAHGAYGSRDDVQVLDATQPAEAVAAEALAIVRAAMSGETSQVASAASAGAGSTAGTHGASALPSVVAEPGVSMDASRGGRSLNQEEASTAPQDEDGESAGWPLFKMRSLEHREEGRDRISCFLLTTGAMNPMHLGHVQLLHQARERLEEVGFRVLGAWVSPSHDVYVQPKALRCRTIGLSGEFRLMVAQHATQEDKFVAAGTWEARAPKFVDFTEVMEVFQDFLTERFPQLRRPGPQGKVTVFYACGTDLADRCGLYRGLHYRRDGGIVVVPREGDEPQAEDPEKRVYVARPAPAAMASFSSTKVRAAIKDKDFDYVQQALSPAAARFLLRPDDEEFIRFRMDYFKLGVDGFPG